MRAGVAHLRELSIARRSQQESPRFVPSRKNSVGTPTGPPIFSPAVKINVGKRQRETDENVENDADDANDAKLRAARLRLERRASSC